jgi:hypothetical protein
MERPASLKVIAALFFLVAAYLVGIGIAEFVSPGTLRMTRATGITYGRDLDGAQSAISIGAGWALVAWGLYRLHNWARWCAVVLMVVGVAGSVPAVSAAARDLGWRFFWYGAQVMVRVVITWYLIFSADAVEAFASHSDSNLNVE